MIGTASPYCSLEDVADRLRIDLTAAPPDPDVEWLTSAHTTACERIDLYYADTPLVAPYPETVRLAAVDLAVGHFRGKDIGSDVSDEWAEGMPVRVGRDPFDAVEPKLAGYRSGAAWSPA